MMKKLSLVWVIIIFAIIGMIGGILYTKSVSAPKPPITQIIKIPTFSPSSTAIPVVEPQTLSIPKLNVQAAVEAVEEDSQGRMDIPKVPTNVGWYSLGYKPGEKGNAVIDGHLDLVTGAPSVFYYLDRLTAGDEVMVTDKTGKTLTFTVTNSVSYPFDQVPLQQIFGPSDKPKLNLITCVGTWNVGTRNYSNRLVVYTELK